MGKLVTPFRVGLMLLVALGVFVVFFTFVRKGGLSRKDALETWAYFHDASGLGPKSRILIAGIPIGEIETITLEGNLAKVTMLIKKEVPVRIDAAVAKKSESILGDYQIDFTPGRSDTLMPNGGQIKNVQDTTGMEQIFGSLSKITDDIQAVTSALRTTLGGDKGAAGMSHVFENLSQISDRLNDTMRVNGERLDAILANFQGVSEDVRSITGSEQERYQAIVANVQHITEDIRDVLGQVKKILGTGQGDMQSTVSSLKETLDKLDKSLNNIEQITDKVNAGQGPVGVLINDKRMGQALSETVLDASDYVQKLTSLQTQVTLRSEFLFNERQTKNYLQVAIIPKPDKYYTLEIVDDPKGTTTQQSIQLNPPDAERPVYQTLTTTTHALKYSLQFNKRYYFATARFGIIENTGGLGLDLHFLQDSLTVKFDAFEFAALDRNYPRLKAYANYSFFNHVYLTAGIDDAINGPVREQSTRKLISGRDGFVGGGVFFTDDDLKALIGSGAVPKP
jgi:phospholipid/cholesterol/gamma-HCH transport system substrate-binding protein